ncbi:MAG: VOC family protein [Acidimicrobiia bacterium]|nr:VOC family protein [Acidimicrobiia bacterium]
MATGPSRPQLQHLVLNVRDIEASERFYELLGFERSGTLEGAPVEMRFYRGAEDRHHDLALIQLPDPAGAPPVPEWKMFTEQPGIAHLALAYPDRGAWLAQIRHLQEHGVDFAVRGDHGMTHSAYVVDPDGHGVEVLYDLPEEVWAGDVNAALSYFKPLPTRGPKSLEDNVDYPVFGAEPAAD